jgi:hypothetical protein
VTLTLPLVAVGEAVTVRVEEPELVTLVGLSVAVSPVVAVAVSWTVPVNPPTAVTVQVLVPEPPWATVMGLVQSMVKSWTLTVTTAEWERMTGVPVIDGVVPLTVTVYVPPVPVHVSMLVPEPPVIVEGLTVQLRPVAGDTVAARVTAPVKPFKGDTMMLVDPATPGVVLIIDGLANIWKSTTWTFIVGVV